MKLDSHQRRHLRGLAHGLNVTVMVGQRGLEPSVLDQIDAELCHHELIKLKVQAGSEHTPAELSAPIADALDCAVVQKIGRILVLFRQNEKEEDRRVPLPAPKKPTA